MQIDLSGNGCLTLLLSDEELASLGLCFEEMDYNTPQTQHMLHALLQLARQETGCPLAGALTIEALPLEGGCLLLITPEDDEPPALPTVWQLFDADALLQLAAAWPDAPSTLRENSALYRLHDHARSFVLVMYGSAQPPLVAEYGRRIGQGLGAAAWAAEHGDPLFIADALPRLHRLVQPDSQ